MHTFISSFILTALVVPIVATAQSQSGDFHVDSFFDVTLDLNSQPGQPSDAGRLREDFTRFYGNSDFRVDSFFDIAYDISVPEVPQCDPCDVLRAELKLAQDELKQVEEDLYDAMDDWAEEARKEAELASELTEARHRLSELTDPQSWIESEGRRVDTSDLRVTENYNAELWAGYQNGTLTTEEYQQRLRDGLTEEEHEARKQRMTDDLRKEVRDLEADLRIQKQVTQALFDVVEALKELIGDIGKRILELTAKLEDCVKRCEEQPVDVIDDYGMGQATGGGFWDWLPGGDDDGVRDTPLGQLPTPLQPPPPIELPPVGLPPLLPLPPSPDKVLAPPIPLIFPGCSECDPILQDIKMIENELTEMAKDLDQLAAELSQAELEAAMAEREFDRAQAEADAFANPSSSITADGRTVDSSDLKVSRAYNAELWAQYRSGDLTAQELEQKWEEGLSDEEFERRKEQMQEDLNEQAEEAQEALDDANENVDATARVLNDAKEATDDMLSELEERQREYDECLKRCMEGPVTIGGLGLLVGEGGDGSALSPAVNDKNTSHMILDYPYEDEEDITRNEGRLDVDPFEEEGSDSSPEGVAPEIVRLTFNDDPIIIQAGSTVDIPVETLVGRSDQKDDIAFDDETGRIRIINRDVQGAFDVRGSSDDDTPEGFWCGTLGWFCDDDDDDDGVPVEESVEQSSQSSEESSSSEGVEQVGRNESDIGFLCRTFGWFCDDDDDEDDGGDDKVALDLSGLVDCMNAAAIDDSCREMDKNEDGNVTIDDLGDVTPVLLGPDGYRIPLDIDGMDGDDALSIGDFTELDNCLSGNPDACSDLNFTPPPITGGPGDDILGGGDFGLGLQNGNDLLLGGQSINDDLIGVGGRDIIGGPDTTLDDDFFTPPPGSFGGDDLIIGDPGSDRLRGGPGDDTLLGGNDDILGGGRDDLLGGGPDDPLRGGPDPLLGPPGQGLLDPPTTPQQVPEKVQQIIRRLAERANLGPCEKLIVRVTKARIGNKVKFTITARRASKVGESCDDGNACTVGDTCNEAGQCVGDPVNPDDGDECTEDACNPETGEVTNTPIPECGNIAGCTKEGGFDSMEACQDACPTSGACGFDGGSCYLCQVQDEEEDENACQKENGYDSMGACQAACDTECSYDGGSCFVCQEDEDWFARTCERSATTPFLSKKECESISSLCPSDTHECKSFVVGEPIATDCWGCIPKELEKQCPSGQYRTSQEAFRDCVVGTTPIQDPESECWSCPDLDELSQDACPDGGMQQMVCIATCTGNCVPQGRSVPGGLFECHECQEPADTSFPSPLPEEQCDSPTMDLADCETSCEDADQGQCVTSYTRDDGRKCYSCEAKEEEDEDPQCPSGKVADRAACDAQCDGTCEADDNGCYGCVVYDCPDNTYKDECPSSCSNGCDVAAEQGGTTCYVCKQSCEDLCASNGFAKVGTDWSSYIQSQIEAYSCVSGASVSLQTATIGSCTCSNEPTVTIDQTPPVCTGTVCGDVACGETVSCPAGENTTATVSCNWGGWKKIDTNKFQPVVGN